MEEWWACVGFCEGGGRCTDTQTGEELGGVEVGEDVEDELVADV